MLAIGAGHSFVILLREGFPVKVLNPVKAVPEVCTTFCATANPVDILVAVTNRGPRDHRRDRRVAASESSRMPTSTRPARACCGAPWATSSDNQRRPGRHARRSQRLLMLRMSPDEGCLPYPGFPKP